MAWTESTGRGRLRVHLEDERGRELWSRVVQLGRGGAEYHPALPCGDRVLVRDGDALRLGDEVLAPGVWEAYSGLCTPAGTVVIAWQPCQQRPCPASVITRDAGGWRSRHWSRELFGVDLAEAGSGVVALATRESPTAAGWTLRMMALAALLRGELPGAPVASWRPPRGLSLEDPGLVRGASGPQLAGEAYDLEAGGLCPSGRPCGAPSGRVFLAEPGGPLREVLRAARSSGNSEIGAAELGGVLYLTAEMDEGSGLWRWQSGRLEMIGQVAGAAPSIAAAEGRVWLASSAGLWLTE